MPNKPGPEHGELIWLPSRSAQSSTASSSRLKRTEPTRSAIRSRAAAWSHQSGQRKQYSRTAGRSWISIAKHGSKSTIDPCIVCRDSSLKCDGRLPCQRCIESGAFVQCAYTPNDGGHWSIITCAPSLYRAPSDKHELRPSRYFGEFKARINAMAGMEARDLMVQLAKEAPSAGELLKESMDVLVAGFASLRPGATSESDQVTSRSVIIQRARVLGLLQRELSKPDAVDNRSIMFAIYLCSWFEILVFENSVAWLMHLDGLCRILQHRGPQSFSTGLEAVAFRRTRMLSITLDIFLRRASFLATEDWLNIPWASSKTSKSLVDKLVDALVHIPGILAKNDEYVKGNVTKQTFDAEVSKVTYVMHEYKVKHLCTAAVYKSCFGLGDHGNDLEAIGSAIVDRKIADEEYAYAFTSYLAGWLMLLRLGTDYRHFFPMGIRRMVELIVSVREVVTHKDGMAIVGKIAWLFPIRIAYMTPLGDEKLSERIRKFMKVRLSGTEALTELPKFGGKISLTAATKAETNE